MKNYFFYLLFLFFLSCKEDPKLNVNSTDSKISVQPEIQVPVVIKKDTMGTYYKKELIKVKEVLEMEKEDLFYKYLNSLKEEKDFLLFVDELILDSKEKRKYSNILKKIPSINPIGEIEYFPTFYTNNSIYLSEKSNNKFIKFFFKGIHTVYNPADGVVISIDSTYLNKNKKFNVTLKNKYGFETKLSNLTQIFNLTIGKTVNQGRVVGFSGYNSNYKDYFEYQIYKNSKTINPSYLLNLGKLYFSKLNKGNRFQYKYVDKNPSNKALVNIDSLNFKKDSNKFKISSVDNSLKPSSFFDIKKKNY